jgi:hypothetical protein
MRRGLVLVPLLLACSARAATEPGLLFYVSGSRGTDVDFSAAGTRGPRFASGVSRVADGARGPALRCEHTQVLAYEAPGNIYAQRGTLALFFRARDPVGPTEFPIFRVSYADHSSWDMVFLRIDYNGHGFDAFVTDASLARTRVSTTIVPFPGPSTWVHLALAWDETRGVRFYVDGKLAAVKEARARYDAALDQLGPFSRIISPHNVQSDYNFVRGGDIDELRVYDRMLDDAAVARLARGAEAPDAPAQPPRALDGDARFRDEWWFRYGWNRAGDPPPYVAGPTMAVRKVEIHDAYDLKRWWWKANDGIRETTWPGVYNRSRLPGRSDYFTLLDWDCYSVSGRAVTFTLPDDEPWNDVEIQGAAPGTMTLVGGLPLTPTLSPRSGEREIFRREPGQERTYHRLAAPVTGGRIRFDSVDPEQPIGELAAFLVSDGAAPAGRDTLRFRLGAPSRADAELGPLRAFIDKRYPPDERALLVAEPAGAATSGAPPPARPSLPLVHILIPASAITREGLDGIALDLPPLRVRPTHGELFPLNVQIKDPLWPLRDLIDVSIAVKPGEAKTLWLDTRDRLLPPGRSLYLTIAGAGADFGAATLAGAELRLLFKPRAEARREHVPDRFTQMRDAYAMLVEEHPADARFDLWNRFKGDLDDLLRVDPDHELGRQYAAAVVPGATHPLFTQPAPPPGVPLWAFRQVRALDGVKRLVLWYVDHRQIDDGELGGGLSDDTDLTNVWPGAALMGCEPDKLRASLRRVLEACYANGMLVHGLPAAQADELHGYEEGINAIAQNMLLDYGNPTLLERAMETTRGVAALTGVNAAGHRHFRTSYYSATRVAEDSVWGWAKSHMTLLLHPGLMLADWNGNPTVRRLVEELADGLLAHRQQREGAWVLPPAIHFATDRESFDSRDYFPWPLFWASWRWTGDRKYLGPLLDGGVTSVLAVSGDLIDELGARDEWRPRILGGEVALPTERRSPGDVRGQSLGNVHRRSSSEHFAWQLTGDKSHLEKLYAGEIEDAARHEYINTEGSIWIDRVVVPHADLQRARLGGVALVRNAAYPGHVVSWSFDAPATDQSVAVLVPSATPTAFDVVAYNLETRPVRARMTTWNVEPGTWTVTRGLDTDGDDRPDRAVTTTTLTIDRGGAMPLTLPPRATTVLRFRLAKKGVPYAARPDLGIGREDVTLGAGKITVRVHSLGAVPAPAARLVFRDGRGRVRAEAPIPPLEAPVDLVPRVADVTLALPAGVKASPGTVELQLPDDPALPQITSLNDRVRL